MLGHDLWEATAFLNNIYDAHQRTKVTFHCETTARVSVIHSLYHSSASYYTWYQWCGRVIFVNSRAICVRDLVELSYFVSSIWKLGSDQLRRFCYFFRVWYWHRSNPCFNRLWKLSNGESTHVTGHNIVTRVDSLCKVILGSWHHCCRVSRDSSFWKSWLKPRNYCITDNETSNYPLWCAW